MENNNIFNPIFLRREIYEKYVTITVVSPVHPLVMGCVVLCIDHRFMS